MKGNCFPCLFKIAAELSFSDPDLEGHYSLHKTLFPDLGSEPFPVNPWMCDLPLSLLEQKHNLPSKKKFSTDKKHKAVQLHYN